LNKVPPAGFLGLSWKRFQALLLGAAGNFGAYRELAAEPLKIVFAFLLILVLAVTVLLAARDLYLVYRYLDRTTAMLVGKIPPITIEDGKVSCPEAKFEFRSDKPFAAGTYRERLSMSASGVGKALARLEEKAPKGEELESEDLARLRQTALQFAAASAWADSVFPDPGTPLDRARVETALARAREAGEISAEAAAQATLAAEDGFVFRVDLEETSPSFRSPFTEGIIFTRERIVFQLPFWPEPIDLGFLLNEKESRTIDNESLPRLKKLVLWSLAPMIVIIHFLRYLVARLLQVLLGSLAVWSVVRFYRARIPFRAAFAVAVFALTVPVFLGLLLDLFSLVIPAQITVFLALYLVYCALGARRYSSL